MPNLRGGARGGECAAAARGNRNNMAPGNGDSGGALGRLLEPLENKLIFLLASVLLGISGNQILLTANPSAVRPDPFTGTDAKELESRLLRELDSRLAPHNSHLLRANAGWDMIYECRRSVAVLESEIKELRSGLQRIAP